MNKGSGTYPRVCPDAAGSGVVSQALLYPRCAGLVDHPLADIFGQVGLPDHAASHAVQSGNTSVLP